MQQPYRTKPQNRFTSPRHAVWLAGAVAATTAVAALLAASGCGGGPQPGTVHDDKNKPFAGATLTLSCPDAAFTAVVEPLAKAWAARNGAAVSLSAGPLDEAAADAGIIPAAELGTWAERGDLLPVPAALREPGHPYQWLSVVGAYRGEPFAGWGGQVRGVPLAGGGHVLVYRADRFADARAGEKFRTRFGRALVAPAAWEEFADAAAFFAELDGQPSLPAESDLADRFFRVATCYDRLALGETGAVAGEGPRTDRLAFQFRLDTAAPRLETPGFLESAKLLHRLKPQRGTEVDPVAALAGGKAVMAVLSLADLGRLRVELPRHKDAGLSLAKFGIAPLPGSRHTFDAAGKPVPNAGNYVPHFADGRLGVVRSSCARPDAAFDLLADLGGPARSLELLGTPGLGVGPFRDNHLDRDRLLVWYGYGFDEKGTVALQDALRSFVAKTVRNPTYALRGPDRVPLTSALTDELKKVAAREVSPEEGLKRATAAWEKLDAAMPRDKLREWRRKAVGLE